MDPAGRFLARDMKTNTWYDVGDEKAREKVSQALRENALTLRKEMEAAHLEQQKKKAMDEAIACVVGLVLQAMSSGVRLTGGE